LSTAPLPTSSRPLSCQQRRRNLYRNRNTDNILAKSPTRTIDLENQFVLPGLHIAHSHLMLGVFQILHEASLGGAA
jgi:hypothetical protein